jgi:hypothetical protein
MAELRLILTSVLTHSWVQVGLQLDPGAMRDLETANVQCVRRTREITDGCSTGCDRSGLQRKCVSDEQVTPVTPALAPGGGIHRIWRADQAPNFPDAGLPSPQLSYLPPARGFRFAFFTVGPVGTRFSDDFDVSSATVEFEKQLPGLLSHFESGNKGIQTTDTIDFEIVISGEVVLELDNGAQTLLRPGDTVVQNGPDIDGSTEATPRLYSPSS